MRKVGTKERLREERFITKVVDMHYKRGMSQQEIGKALNVSRPTVSRALTKAKKEGYVEIKINHLDGSMIPTEEVLENKFHLKEAIIASKRKDEDIGDTVAFYASDYLLRIIKNNMILAMSRGVTLQKMVESLEKDVRRRFLRLQGIEVVPLEASTNVLATASRAYRLAYSNYLTEEVAALLNGNGYQILAPQYVSSAQTKRVLMEEKSIKDIFDIAAAADAAFIGIGTVESNSAVMNAELMPPKEFQRLSRKGGVGEIIAYVLDENGDLLDDPIVDRLICLELGRYKKIPIRVGVAYGMKKKEAILCALKGGWINVLITDEEVAEYLVEAKI